MANIKCSQCGYFDNNCADCRCKRYSISVDKDTICVDNEEVDDLTDSKS